MPNNLRVQKLDREAPEILNENLKAIITLFSKSVNVQMNLSQEQIQVIARDLINDCPDWHIYDFVLFFKSCSKGKYGSIQYSLDETKIYQYLKLYEAERSEAREQIAQNEKESFEDIGKSVLENYDKLPALKELFEENKKEEEMSE